MENLLEIKSLNTYYGESHILRDVDLNVKSGEMVCLIGRNGVGKTTLLKSLIGLLKQKKGDIYLVGENINRKAPHQRARKGMAYVPQGREIIPYLSVEENLMLGMESLPGGLSKNKKIDPFIYDLFPILKDFLQRKGGDLSGGQQQQLAIARALIKQNPENRKVLKEAGYLTRDSRVKESKKYGLVKARKAKQFSKR